MNLYRLLFEHLRSQILDFYARAEGQYMSFYMYPFVALHIAPR